MVCDFNPFRKGFSGTFSAEEKTNNFLTALSCSSFSFPCGKQTFSRRKDERYRLTFDWRLSTLGQSDIRVHWWTHNSKNPTNLGRREFNATLHQSSHGFATPVHGVVHGFATKSTRARNPASYAGRWRNTTTATAGLSIPKKSNTISQRARLGTTTRNRRFCSAYVDRRRTNPSGIW